MATEMLESYVLSCKKKGGIKDYDLKFKVAKGVKVTFTEKGDINEIHLNHDPLAFGKDYNKKYNIKGALNVQFFQHPVVGAGKDDPPPPIGPDPDIWIRP